MNNYQKFPEKMEMTCNYIMHNQVRCYKKPYDDEQHCIFHSKHIKKKRAAFTGAFWQEFDIQTAREDFSDFTGFVFPDEISFEGRFFGNRVYFKNARFHEKVNFSKAQFSGKVDFGDAQFLKKASFWKTQFIGHVGFRAVKFKGISYFRYAEFEDETDFEKVQFSGSVDFGDTHFNKKSDFNQIIFGDEVRFERSEFHEHVSFRGSQFYKEADFRQTQFSGATFFTEANFLEKTSFWDAKFSNLADFFGVKFSGEATFVNTQFFGKTIFNQTNFNNLANFMDFYQDDVKNLFMEGSYFFDVSGLLEFIEKNKKKYKFSRRPHKNEFLPDQFTLILGEKAAAKNSLIDRKIRDDMFLLGFRKRHPFWHFLWWISTNCGRSFRVLGIWCFFVPVLFSIVYWFFLRDAFHTTPDLSFTWISSLYFSFITFTTLGFGDITPIRSLAQIIVTLEVIMGYGMLGLLISIMANKLARRS